MIKKHKIELSGALPNTQHSFSFQDRIKIDQEFESGGKFFNLGPKVKCKILKRCLLVGEKQIFFDTFQASAVNIIAGKLSKGVFRLS